MVLPLLIQQLQQQGFLGHADKLRSVVRNLLRHFGVDRACYPLLDLFVGNAFFLSPIRNRQVKTERPPYFTLQR